MEGQYINKLRIASVHLPNFSGNTLSSVLSVASSIAQTAAGGVFELQVNPEQFGRTFTINHKCTPAIGSPLNKDIQFSNVAPETLDIKFTIDGTGLVPFQQPAIDLVTQAFANAGSDAQVAFVSTKLAQLELVAYGIIGEKHRPPFIVINWGKLVFLGVLQSMNQTHTLFHPTGLPLRVEVNLKFLEYKMPSVALAALSLLSPDLTRKRQVKSSDNILTLCEEVYEKPDYYIEVAKANNLTNFRRIEAGKELLFPPIVK